MTSNKLKIIAFVSMIIDHLGLYFSYAISDNTYTYCRVIGRLAMPIFAYLIIQGYFNTKNLKKYKLRLFITGVITQVIIAAIAYINAKYYPEYVTSIPQMLNILFSFFLGLEFICLIDRKIIYSNTKFSSLLDKVIRIFGMALICFIYARFSFDYKYYTPILMISIYIIEKIREFFDLEQVDGKYKLILGTVLFIVQSSSVFIVSSINIFSIFAISLILLYNGKLGKKNRFLKWSYYIMFPLQHGVIYMLAMILQNKIT